MTGPRMSKRLAVLATATSVAVFIALGMAASASGSHGRTDISDARVSVEGRSARLVEQVDYRDGVTRVADMLVADGRPDGDLGNPDLAAAWEFVDSTWPSSMRGDLKQISVIDEGPRGLVGVVHRSKAGGWILSLDRSDFGDRRLVEETIIHELAHVATLGPNQFSFDLEAACDGVMTTVGCAAPGSLMAQWASAFWPGGILDASPSDLVDPYAATAPHEDLAETFTAWVADWPVESSRVRDRYEMLAADPTINLLATQIRNQLD